MFLTRSLALSMIAYLAGASPLILQARAKDSDSSTSQDLKWTKPSSGDTFGPGGTVIGEWTSSTAIVSPSVSMCSQGSQTDDDDDSDCGGTVWPEVKNDGSMSSFSLAVPNITSASNYYLKMKDDFGNISKSPAFSLDPTATDGQSSGAAGSSTSKGITSDGTAPTSTESGSTDSGDAAQVPLNDSSGDTSSVAPEASGLSSKTPHPSSGSKASILSGAPSSSAGSSGGVPLASGPAQSTAGTSKGADSTSSADDNVNDIPLQEHALSSAGLPTAAVAVPIALVGATLLVSLALFFVHRRSLAAQRARNAHLIGIQSNAPARATESKAQSFSSAMSKSASFDDPDIEKAIGALYGLDNKPSRHSSLRRGDSTMYAPVSTRYPVPRQDVRRERRRAYERDDDDEYERRSERRYRPTYSDRYSQPPSPRPRYQSSYSTSERYARSLPAHHRRSNAMRGNRSSRDDEDDGGSTTDSILSEYVSPRLPASRLPRYDSYRARPRAPPRTHSRNTAPEMDGYHYRRQDGPYDPRSSPHARSYRSF